MLSWKWCGLFCVVAAAAVAPGCSSSTTTAVGNAGESCTRRADCQSGLSCVNNVCTSPNTMPDAGLPPVLGQEGETCASRQDCSAGLSCINTVCSKANEADAAPQQGAGTRGESCQTRADCAAGLSCIADTCTVDEYNILPTGKVCKLAACMAAADCCALPAAYGSETCDDLKTLCTSEQLDCDIVAKYCSCAANTWACESNACVFTACKTSVDCSGSATGNTCNTTTGRCVECTADIDCTLLLAGGGTCSAAGQCVPKCKQDADCGIFQTCDTTTNSCVASGCKTDRECVADTKNALSTCGTDGKCVQPCKTDGECSTPTNYNFLACVNGTCVDVGCQTDEECRIRYLGSSTSVAKPVCVAAPTP